MDPITATAVVLAIAVTGYIGWRLRRISQAQRRDDGHKATVDAMEARRARVAAKANLSETEPGSPRRSYDPELD